MMFSVTASTDTSIRLTPTSTIPGVRIIGGPLWLSGGDLRVPIKVEISTDSSGVVVAERRTGIYGAGPDLAAAVADFRAALLDYRDVLEGNPPLGPHLQGTLSILRRHLRP
jgi:hypothetical protein